MPAMSRAGLSPRVRGNRTSFCGRLFPVRSIPARAGEPARKGERVLRIEVYPRACGGTGIFGRLTGLESGLSPRVRGNPAAGACSTRFARSIPARAGEPLTFWADGYAHRVYPRACGGTGYGVGQQVRSEGLSPRVRGNPLHALSGVESEWSIPARAGEPDSGWPPEYASRVYPRACGGTVQDVGVAVIAMGLSPRVRGNRLIVGERGITQRSIPARAGEPRSSRWRIRSARVYPRACGGTTEASRMRQRKTGLSPRVRGNHPPLGVNDPHDRSIPARAGEP